jgi:hypothetical protein
MTPAHIREFSADRTFLVDDETVGDIAVVAARIIRILNG